MARFAASLTVKLLKSGLHVRLLHQGRSYRQSSRTGLATTPRLFPPRLVLTRLANIVTLRDQLGFILATVGIPTRAVAVTRRDPNADRRTNSLNCPTKEGSTSKAGNKAFSARQSAGKADRHPLPIREDAGFHAYQMLEAGVRQFAIWGDTDESLHILIAVARYLAAYSPTERAALQTADVARRMMRGAELHQGAMSRGAPTTLIVRRQMI
jgi:hypothetical protein